jgi:ATP adenylyltransferase
MPYVGASSAAPKCIFCAALADTDDRRRLVVRRAERAFLMLNAYPYASGHLMAVLNRHVGTIAAATVDELTDALGLVQVATSALAAEYRAEGFNVGINEGRIAGAGIADHLHVHVVPRWSGDTNFMAVTGDVKVLPEALEATWERLRGRLHG